MRQALLRTGRGSANQRQQPTGSGRWAAALPSISAPTAATPLPLPQPRSQPLSLSSNLITPLLSPTLHHPLHFLLSRHASTTVGPISTRGVTPPSTNRTINPPPGSPSSTTGQGQHQHEGARSQLPPQPPRRPKRFHLLWILALSIIALHESLPNFLDAQPQFARDHPEVINALKKVFQMAGWPIKEGKERITKEQGEEAYVATVATKKAERVKEPPKPAVVKAEIPPAETLPVETSRSKEVEEKALLQTAQESVDRVSVAPAASATPTQPEPTPAAVQPPPPPQPTEPVPTPASSSSTEDSELAAALTELATLERSMASFVYVQNSRLRSELDEIESELRYAGAQRLAHLERHQKRMLDRAIRRQDGALFRTYEQRLGPMKKEFEIMMEWEEENKRRAQLYDALYEQNEEMSAVADHWLQFQEKQITNHYNTYLTRLQNASTELETVVLRKLREKLSIQRHKELRSRQAHRLASAFIELQNLLQKDHESIEVPWKVVEKVARDDSTLAAAIATIDPDVIQHGLYSISSLQNAFDVLSKELKLTTFLPDDERKWSLFREVIARIFAFLTLNEQGSVIMPATEIRHEDANTSSSPSRLASTHASSDYAHFINASTYLASSSLELALAELSAMQPSRRRLAEPFLEELAKAVHVQQAMRVIKYRVQAMNHEAKINMMKEE